MGLTKFFLSLNPFSITRKKKRRTRRNKKKQTRRRLMRGG